MRAAARAARAGAGALGPGTPIAAATSPPRASPSRCSDTVALAWQASTASSARCLVAPSGIGRSSSIASTGPSSCGFMPVEWSVGVAWNRPYSDAGAVINRPVTRG
jgi:hypothetical protein